MNRDIGCDICPLGTVSRLRQGTWAGYSDKGRIAAGGVEAPAFEQVIE